MLLCQERDLQVGATLGTNFRTVIDRSQPYSVREQFSVPLVLGRKHVDLFHAPHYVLPPLVRCRSVVTIHDCIHLMFPQYLPNRFALAYAHSSIWMAARTASRILTVSEASKRDILRFFDVPPEKIAVIYNGIDDRFHVKPRDEDIERVRERYQLQSDFVLYVGQRQAAQEPRAAARRVPSRAAGRARPPEAGRDRRRDLEVRRSCAGPCTATTCTSTSGSSATCPTRRWRCSTASPRSSCFRRSTRDSACRRSRRWRAGRRSSPRTCRRCPEVVGDAAVLVDPTKPASIADGIAAGPRRTRRSRPSLVERGLRPCAPSSRGSGRCAQIRGIYGERAPPGPDARRPRPRLADRHARGREGPRGALRAATRAPTSSRWSTCRGSVSAGDRAAPHPTRRSSSGCRRSRARYRHYLPLFPTAVELFDLDGYDLVISTSHCAAKAVVGAGRGAPSLLLLHADALRVGPVRRLLRAGSAGRAGERAGRGR